MLSGDEPEIPLDDDHQPDYNTGPDPDDITNGDQEYIIPDDYGPPPDHDLDMPGIQDSGETQNPSSPSTPFSNPDVPIEEIADPGQDDDPSPGPDPTSEPIRVQRKQRQISTDSTDALPKAKAKVIEWANALVPPTPFQGRPGHYSGTPCQCQCHGWEGCPTNRFCLYNWTYPSLLVVKV